MARPKSLPAGLKKYRVSSRFGPRALAGSTNHLGCDWATPVGVPLEAIIDGVVSAVGGSLTHGWGYYVHIKDGTDEVEYHILRDKPTFKLGQKVKRGQLIGYTGNSGALRGNRYNPHHHLGTKSGGWYYDPLSIGWPDSAAGLSKPLDNAVIVPQEEDTMYPVRWNDKHKLTLSKQYVKHETNAPNADFTRNVIASNDQFVDVDDQEMEGLCASFGIEWYGLDQVLRGKGPGGGGRVWSRELEIILILRNEMPDANELRATFEDVLRTADLTPAPEDKSAPKVK